MTSEAPERIWAWYARSQDGEWLGQHCATDRKPNAQGAAEYIRADLHQQALEAAEARGRARADGGNAPCPGKVRIELRDNRVKPSTPPRDGVE